jgi:hypothetical protein
MSNANRQLTGLVRVYAPFTEQAIAETGSGPGHRGRVVPGHDVGSSDKRGDESRPGRGPGSDPFESPKPVVAVSCTRVTRRHSPRTIDSG